MLAERLHRSRALPDHHRVLTRSREDLGECHPAGREGAGLVEHDGVDASGVLQHLGSADENPQLGPSSCAHQQCRRRCEAECTRARDDEDSDSRRERRLHVAGEKQPCEQREHGDHQDRGHEDGRDPIGEALHRSLARLRLHNEPCDVGEVGVCADTRGCHRQGSVDVDRGSRHRITRCHVNGHRLPCQQGGIDSALARDDDAIGRDPLARSHDEYVADPHLRGRHLGLHPIDDHRGFLGGQVGQRPQSLGGAALRARFEPSAGQQKDWYGGCHLEVEVRRTAMGSGEESVRHGVVECTGTAEHQCPQAPEIGGENADAHEGVHGRGAMSRIQGGGSMEGPGTPRHDDGGQGEGQPLPPRELQRRHHGHQRHGRSEHERDPESPAQVVDFGVIGGRIGGKRGRVARLLHHSHEIGDLDPGVEVDMGTLRRVVDGRMDTRHAVELALDAGGARGAGHAAYSKLDRLRHVPLLRAPPIRTP